MSAALHAALSSLQQRAAWEDVAARTDDARARQVLCRRAALARDHTGRLLNTLAAESRPLSRALDEAAGDTGLGAE